MSYDRTCLLSSNKHEEIRRKIIEDLNRGGTFITGEGMYNGEQKIIFTSVSHREVALLEDFIHSVDPDAFMTVIEANEILGKGFKSLTDKVRN